MANVNIYLPDHLADEARTVGLNVSRVCRSAIEDPLKVARQTAWLEAVRDLPPVSVQPHEVLEAVRAARDDLEGTLS